MQTVVLLHPGGTDSSAMADTAAGLAGRFEVRTPTAATRRSRRWQGRAWPGSTPRRPARRSISSATATARSSGSWSHRPGPTSSGASCSRPAYTTIPAGSPAWSSGPGIASEPALGSEELARIAVPTLVMAADRDEMPLEHTAAMFRALPSAQLAIVPGTDHGSLADRPDLCNAIIAGFLAA